MIAALLIVVTIVLAILEIATWMVTGPPWITLPLDILEKELDKSNLNSLDKSIISTPDGYISTYVHRIPTSIR